MPIDHFISTLRDCIVEHVKTNQYHISSENTKYLLMFHGSKTTVQNVYDIYYCFYWKHKESCNMRMWVSFSSLASGCIYIVNYPRLLNWLATPAIVAPRSFGFISFSKYKSRMTLAYFSILCLTVNHLIFRRCILITFIGLNIIRFGCWWPVGISLKSTKVF